MKFGGEMNICAHYVPEFLQIFWSGGPFLKIQKTAFFFSYFAAIFGLCRLTKGSYDKTDSTIVLYAKKYIKNMYNPCCQYFSAIQWKITTENQTATGTRKSLDLWFNLFYSLSLICALSSKNIDCKYCAHYSGIFP